MKKAGPKEKRCCNITGKRKECTASTGVMSAELLSHGCNRVRVMQQMATNCPQEEALEFKAMLQDDFALNSRERCISPTACCEVCFLRLRCEKY